MTGWKTKTGSIIAAISPVAGLIFPGLSQILLGLGVGLGLFRVGHKVEKNQIKY